MQAIVLILRGCPAGWLGPYGNEWVVTPHLDQLAAESVVFDRHISDCPEPEAADRAWLGPDSSLLASLKARSIPLILVRANHPDTDAPDWFYAGWSERFDARPLEGDRSPLDALLRVLPPLLARLAKTPDFLLWIEIDRLLPPWDVSDEVFRAYLEHETASEEPEEEDEEIEEDERDDDLGEDGADDEEEAEEQEVAEADDEAGAAAEPGLPDEPITPWSDPPTGPFDTSDSAACEWLATSFGAVVTMLDSELGAVLEQIRAAGLDRSAAWLVTSDFGYPLGEHGQIGLYRPWLHEELVHVPLILRLPLAAEAGRRVPALTQPPDVRLTLLDLFGLLGPEEKSLLVLARGETASIRDRAITTLTLGGAAEVAIRTEEWAYLRPARVPEGEKREPQLYRKPEDRWEVNDLRFRNIERTDELDRLLPEG